MKQDYYEYAKKLSEIGNTITNISNKFSRLDFQNTNINLDILKRMQSTCLQGVIGYRNCLNNLVQIMPPNIVKDEHEDIIRALQMFINGTDNLYNSIDLNGMTIQLNKAKRGFLLQEQGKQVIVNTSNVIAKKLANG